MNGPSYVLQEMLTFSNTMTRRKTKQKKNAVHNRLITCHPKEVHKAREDTGNDTKENNNIYAT